MGEPHKNPQTKTERTLPPPAGLGRRRQVRGAVGGAIHVRREVLRKTPGGREKEGLRVQENRLPPTQGFPADASLIPRAGRRLCPLTRKDPGKRAGWGGVGEKSIYATQRISDACSGRPETPCAGGPAAPFPPSRGAACPGPNPEANGEGPAGIERKARVRTGVRSRGEKQNREAPLLPNHDQAFETLVLL